MSEGAGRKKAKKCPFWQKCYIPGRTYAGTVFYSSIGLIRKKGKKPEKNVGGGGSVRRREEGRLAYEVSLSLSLIKKESLKCSSRTEREKVIVACFKRR